ncbi:hypothetical protein [Calidithermus timidus]|uniref:hypothetical protein n=1 Tax=Calidithermus timidus TaxID=307124 RepID=UPI00037D839E|nr:hypothetical protein [Calidithermus timidus]
MRLDISLPSILTLMAVWAAVEQAARELGLTITLRTTLAQYPGSTHWHFKQGRTRGIVEATYWPQQHRLWLSIKPRAVSEHTLELAERLRAEIERNLLPKV